MLRLKIIPILFFLCASYTAKAWEHSHWYKHYDIKTGLSNTHINCIAQDSSGLLWIGTEDGLNCFDGLEFSIYFHSPGDSTSLSSSAVYAVHISPDKTMWVGTFKGIDVYCPKNRRFKHKVLPVKNKHLAYTPVKAIKESNDGILWLGTSGAGVIAVRKETWELVFHIHPDFFPVLKSGFITTIHVSSNGLVYFGTENNGVYSFDPVNKILRNEATVVNNRSVTVIYENTDGTLWFGTIFDGLYVYNPKTGKTERFEKFYNLPLDFSSITIYSILKEQAGKVWIGTNGNGVFRIDLNKKTIETERFDPIKKQGISGDKIRVIFKDRQENIWFGIHQKGIDMLAGFRYPFRHYYNNPQSPVSLSNNSVLGIGSDDAGNIWVGTDGGGINIINRIRNHVTVYTAENSPQWKISNVVRAITTDYRGNIWIGFYMGGLACYDIQKKQFKTFLHDPAQPGSLSNNDVTDIVQDKLGNLWVATNGGGLNLFDPLNNHFIHYRHDPENLQNTISSDWLVSLYLDSEGMIWIGSYWGLSRLNPMNGLFRNYSAMDNDQKSLSNNTVLSMLEDSKHRFWVGTWSGLNLMDKNTGQCLVFTIQDGLPNNVINGILEDREGNLWISTNNGICRFNYDRMTFSNFFEYEGLQSNEFIHGSYHKTVNGEMFFGGINGLTSFYPEEIKADYSSMKIMLSDLIINHKSILTAHEPYFKKILNQPLNDLKKIELPYKCNNIRISFVSIDYIFPERIQYAFILEGFEENWQYTDYKKRQASFTNLDPGVYYFKYKSTDANGNWPDEPEELTIIIHPPVWLTLPARLIYLVILVLLVYLVVRYYLRKIRKRNFLKLERIKKEKEEELNKAKLQFFTNISHEFRTPLTLIIGPLEELLSQTDLPPQLKERIELMHRSVKRMLRLVNELLDLRKQETGNMQLKAMKGDIVDFIKQICLAFEPISRQKNIRFDVKTAFNSYLIWFDADKVDKIIFNLLSNAFRFTPRGGIVEVAVDLSFDNRISNEPAKYIKVTVNDSGKGIPADQHKKIFQRFYQADEHGNYGGTGLGLSLALEFAEMHKGTITVESEPGKGSRFTLLLPTGENHLTKEDKVIGQAETTQSRIDEEIRYEYIESDDKQNSDENAGNGLPTVLIVEDDHDLCSYIHSILGKEYHIEEAYNGREGLEKARDLLPDIIISDVMMPEMDGMELCRSIKTDFQTCHIPVILLTAKVSEEYRITGIETGADSYIPKPFNPQHLEVRVRKLIELRQTLREKFSSDGGFDVKDLAVTSADEKFMQKLMEVINQKITDPTLSVEMLGKEIGMSRSHLHRKLKSLTGQVPNEFIRLVRLKMAAKLLKTSDVSISEVTYLIGFNNPSYFSTCFSKHFGISPTQYKEKYYTGKAFNNKKEEE